MARPSGKTLFETARENPFSVLGVAEDGALLRAYRAYLERIEKSGPASDAGQFARYSDAYEQVREVHREAARRRAARLVQAAEEPAVNASLPESAESRRAELFFALAHGHARRARQLLDALHASGSLSWAALREEPDRRRALWLFAEHIDRELLAGRAAALEDQVTSAEFAAELASHPGLELLAYRVLGVSARRDPTVALRFLRDHPPPHGLIDADGTILDADEVLAQLARAVSARGDEGVASGSALARALELGFITAAPGGEPARALLDELGEGAEALARLDTLAASAPAALERLAALLERWAPRDDRLWLELSTPEQSYLWTFAQELESALDASWRNRLMSWSILVMLAASGWLWHARGLGYATLFALACLVVWTVLLLRNDGWLHRKVLRPRLVARLAKTGACPDRLFECLVHLKTGASDLGRFRRTLFRDEALDVLCALERLRSALERSLHAPPALRALPATESVARQSTGRA
jgi:hypothetical protein